MLSTQRLCRVGLAALLTLSAVQVSAQAIASSVSGSVAGERSPYYLGASQGFTHDSNVFRVPFGPSDNYSSTSLLAGFDQPFSRQRAYGTVSVSYNRYQDQTELNNTSYALRAGIDWETIWKLSGNVTATLDRNLAAPVATVATPEATRNVQKQKGLAGLARWGGDQAISAEGRLGYSTQDYSSGQSESANSKNQYGSLGAFYRPGPTLQLGVAARLDRSRAPSAIRLADGSSQGNETRGRNVDFLANYNNGSSVTAGARLSYTRQTNSSLDQGADFSGLTGGLNVGYRATGKLSFNLAASRDAGFNNSTGPYAIVVVPATPTAPATISRDMTTKLYENNQVTNSLSAGASYAATAKINLTAGARYARAKIITTNGVAGSGNQASANVRDETKGASLGANYAFSRALAFACSLSRDRREVSGAASYGYTDDIAACSAQFTWR